MGDNYTASECLQHRAKPIMPPSLSSEVCIPHSSTPVKKKKPKVDGKEGGWKEGRKEE